MTAPMPGSRRFATVLLVDDDGRVLLQERDQDAPRAANLWGMVGGHVEEGEDLDAAVYRELAEETGSSHHFVVPLASAPVCAALRAEPPVTPLSPRAGD